MELNFCIFVHPLNEKNKYEMLKKYKVVSIMLLKVMKVQAIFDGGNWKRLGFHDARKSCLYCDGNIVMMTNLQARVVSWWPQQAPGEPM